MEYVSVIDISSVIWDKHDFAENTDQYYTLRTNILNTIERLEKERLKYLLRPELLNFMIADFPYIEVGEHFTDFSTRIFTFLSLAELIKYPANASTDFSSVPDFVKVYYRNEVKTEVAYLVSELHTNKENEQVYFTFNYLWQNNHLLKTNQASTNVTYEYATVVADRNDELETFFYNRKKQFDHNNKHKKESRIVGGKVVSRLSCYDGQNSEPAQLLLDGSVASGDTWWAYDLDNDVYIRFFNHLNNLYHAHDEEDLKKVPRVIRKHFNK